MRFGRLAAVLIGLAAGGCGGRPDTHPVSGRVTVAGGDPAALAGHAVEASLAADPTMRAVGVIGPDGRFALETLRNGKVDRGAPAGRYAVRIVLAREGDGRDRRPPLAPRFEQFKGSGLVLDVPAAGEVQLAVAAK